MKILYVLEHYHPHIGGVETVFKNICEGMAERGHSVKVITTRLPGTQKKEELNGVFIERITTPAKMARYFFAFLSIPKTIKEAKKSDLIHTTTFSASFPAWLGGVFSGKKTIITVHEVWVNMWKKVTEKSRMSALAHNFLEKRIYSLNFDKYVCVSNATRRELVKQKIDQSKVMTIHNGMDYEHWAPEKYDGKGIRKKLGIEKSFVYLGYGRPGTSKGFEYLIKAVPLISAEIKNSKLVMILSKDKAYEKEYEKLTMLIERLGIKEKIIILDPAGYAELPNYVKMADCIVVPSLSEGFGYTCIEGCAMKKPVVASNTASLPEVITGKGKLVNPADEKAIAEGVTAVFKGKTDIFPEKKFLWETAIESYEKLYKELA
jgi:glycosyltransferase involved in cell wall biosynthesis